MRRVALLSVALLCAYAAGCRRESPSTQEPAARAPTPAAPAAAFPYAEAGIADLQAAMDRGETSSHALVQAYLARIVALDRNGPKLHSVIELNPLARAEAAALDAERAAGHIRGPLHGIPILLKDNIDATPMATTAGSLALAGFHPPGDAFLVARLRQAGAVILGKANLSEWANFRSTRSTSGWSSVGGQTRNHIGKLATTGAGTADATWNPDLNNNVYSVSTDGTSVYAGGLFTYATVVLRNNIAKVNADGTIDMTWNPDASSAIYTLTNDGTNLYAGGNFTTIGGQFRNYIAKLRARLAPQPPAYIPPRAA